MVSALGNQQNITKDIHRWNLDSHGVPQQYASRHPDQAPTIQHFDTRVTESLERLQENGEDAVNLTPESFAYALEDFDFVFVDFFAGWCSHCQDCTCMHMCVRGCVCCSACGPLSYHARQSVILTRRLLVFF